MENLENLILEEMPEPEPTEFEKTIQNITDIQTEWDKPQEPTEMPPLTPEQIAEVDKVQEKAELSAALKKLSEDITQYEAGEKVPDITKRKAKFITLHNRLRELEGKPPREVR